MKTWAGDSQWRALQADYQRFRLLGHSGWASEAFWGLAIYRMQRTIAKARAPWLWAPAAVFLAILHKLLGILTGIDLHPEAEIGAGLFIAHGSQVTVIKGARLGVDCTLAQVCTIGAEVTPGVPNIGDHVYISSHSCVLGPVTVGEGATIAGNSLVISDVPARHTAIGVPARILPLFKDQRFRKDNISALNLKAVPEVAPPTPMLD